MNNVNPPLMQTIRERADSFTPIEKLIAEYFLNLSEDKDLSSKAVAAELFVSEASLSRFAKKCGYSGYREFIYAYRKWMTPSYQDSFLGLTVQTLDTWQSLLNKTKALVDEIQLQRVSRLILEKERIYLYGYGSSGIAASEIKTRLMRIGILTEIGTDIDQMRIYSALADESCLIIAMTVSGQSLDVLRSARMAKERHAAVVLMTAANPLPFLEFCDEVISIASTTNLSSGTLISPQFPLLIMFDILYSYCLYDDYDRRSLLHASTLTALHHE